MSIFADLNLHERLLKAIDTVGFCEPTVVQQTVIPIVLDRKDVMVAAKTGSGKTAAFLLPLLQLCLDEHKPCSSTRGLILSPTRELALQIQAEFERFARFTFIKSGLIIGGELYRHQVATLRKNPEIIIATPGRLVEHIEKGNIDLADLEVLVLDEADRMLNLGFVDAMNTIGNACNQERQSLLFSATLAHHHMSKITGLLNRPINVELDDFRDEHSHITQQMILADHDTHKEQIVAALIDKEKAQKVFVFCKTRLQCQKVSNVLRAQKFRSAYIHSAISQSDRKQILNQFRDDKLQVLVATDLAARGINIENADLVINFAVARSGDDHVHRVGRVGRAGNEGLAVTLVSADEWNLMASITRYLKIQPQRRKIDGLVGHYKGPKKVKASGKALGVKKKNQVNRRKKSPEVKKNNRQKKNDTVKTRLAQSPSQPVSGDGYAPFRKKKDD